MSTSWHKPAKTLHKKKPERTKLHWEERICGTLSTNDHSFTNAVYLHPLDHLAGKVLEMVPSGFVFKSLIDPQTPQDTIALNGLQRKCIGALGGAPVLVRVFTDIVLPAVTVDWDVKVMCKRPVRVEHDAIVHTIKFLHTDTILTQGLHIPLKHDDVTFVITVRKIEHMLQGTVVSCLRGRCTSDTQYHMSPVAHPLMTWVSPSSTV